MSPLTQALVINAAVLVAVLEADLGPHRKIGWFRLLRPVLLAGAIVPMYLTALASHGIGLTLEIAGAAAGLLVGLVATGLMRVYRSPRTGRPVSRAGVGYAAVWVLVVGARTAFSYGSSHWFSSSLDTWMGEHHVTGDMLTNTLILMAIAMVLTRTGAMAARAHAVRHESVVGMTDAAAVAARPAAARSTRQTW